MPKTEGQSALAQQLAERAVSADWLQGAFAVNLDEVVIDDVVVSIVERAPVQLEDGTEILKAKVRKATISTYVPMQIFNSMMQTYSPIAQAEPAERLRWVAEQVLAVWKLTEPQMTLDRLVNGLDFDKISALFAHFFADQLRRQNARV